jgi:hypothetical protein
MRAREFVAKTVPAQKVLQYVKQAQAPDEFNIEYSITDHPEWQLTNIPLTQLKLDPDGEQQDPYRRVNWVDYDKVAELVPRIESILKSMPIVVDANGWIIDGNHRAAAAVEAGMTSVPAYVPAQELTESFNQCFTRACQLYDRAEAKGIDATLLQVADYQGEGSDADARWQRLPQYVWKHYVTVIGDTVYDPTAKQFGPDKPEKYNLSRLESEWKEIYQIRSTSVTENFADGKVKGKSRPGRVKRAGASCNGSVTDLRARAKKASGEKAKMYHWCANMKSGRKK